MQLELNFEAPDALRRREALDPSRSFIVEAPAGSGKTELLIQRYLVLLGVVQRPEEIAAITFTIKAAAEMRKRVVEALTRARAEPKPGERHRAGTWELARAALERNDRLGWKLEENTSRLRIQTIDALCAALTRQMPVMARFGAQPEPLEDASDLYREAARATLARLEAGMEEAHDVEALLAHLDNDAGAAVDLIAEMLARRDHWIRVLGAAESRERLESALAALRRETVARARAAFPEQSPVALPDALAIEAWAALAESLLTREGKWRKAAPASSFEGNEALRIALAAVRSLPPARYSDAQWSALGSIMRLAPRAIAELKVVFALHRKADFVEIGQAALRALAGEEGPTDLALALDYRIRHLLVDEFQDTSYTQFELLERLTAGWERGDGRTLFVVGDPMQSIYRFREAEVGLFLRARNRGIGELALEPLALGANFRSQEGIVAWVNETFARAMPVEEDIAVGAVTYTACEAVHPALAESVSVHPFFDNDAGGEALEVARIVRETLQESSGGESPASVAILVRNRRHLEAILPQLRGAGLPFRAIEIESLGHRPVVQDLLALTRALSHLADRVAWLAVLRAPWCGLPLADLHALATAPAPGANARSALPTLWEALHEPGRLAALSTEGRRRALATRDVLARSLANRRNGSLRERVEHAWLALAGPACVRSETDLEDAEIYLDHLEARERAGVLDDEAFEGSVAALFALPDLEASDRLQVMTIHKAKGLEFDTVIVPGLGSGTERDDRKLFLWMDTLEGLLLAPIQAAGSDRDPIYESIRALDKAKADHECARLMYVAATRAKRRLHLLGAVALDPAGKPRAPTRGSLLAKIWPSVASRFEAAAPARAPSVPAPRKPLGDALLRLSADWTMPAAPADLALPGFAPAPATHAEAIEFSWAGEAARHVGSVVHRWLQRIAEDALAGWDRERVESLRADFRRQLAARGVAEREAATSVARVVLALVTAIEDSRGRWLLGAQRDARSELRLTVRVGGARRRLVVDRTFVAGDGRRWIVDYKTSHHEGADLEAFLDAERERYRGQLETYAAALASGQPGALALYFPLYAGWREWEAPEGAVRT